MVIFHSYVSLPESQRVMTWMICGLPFRKPPSATATGCSWMWFFHHPQLKVYLSGFTTLFQMGTFKRNQPVEGRCVCFFFFGTADFLSSWWMFQYVSMVNLGIWKGGTRCHITPYFGGPGKWHYAGLSLSLSIEQYSTTLYIYIYLLSYIYILSN